MKKILLITYMFPPIAGAGIQRVLKFIKYLPSYNIEPIVFCPQNAFWKAMDYNNLELPYIKNTKIYRCGVNKLSRYYNLRYVSGLKSHPYYYLLGIKYIWRLDFFSSWYLECRDHALHIAETENADCILTTSPPHSVHFFGMYLRDKLNVPWIMDLRDAMYSDPNRDYSKLLIKLQAGMEGIHERKMYRKADAIISVSQPILDSICYRHPFLKCEQKTHLITNGFDPEDFENIERRQMKDNKLLITYTGSFMGNQTPEHFLQAISVLCSTKKIDPADILIRFVGYFNEQIIAMFNKYKIGIPLEVVDYQPHEEVLSYQVGSELLLLIISMDEKQGGNQTLTGKFFEYLGAERPIFALAPDGPLKEIIAKGKFGVVSPPKDIEFIAHQFKQLYDKWKGEGILPFEPDIQFRNSFARKKLSEKLASIIHNIV